MDLPAPRRIPAVAHPPEDLVDLGPALGEERRAGLGDAVGPLAVLALGGHVAEVLEHLQGRIDRARAGGVEAAHALLERAHQLVTMGRLVLEQFQDHVLEIPLLEHPRPKTIETVLPVRPHGCSTLLFSAVSRYIVIRKIQTSQATWLTIRAGRRCSRA